MKTIKENFESWASDNGAYDFTEGHNVNGCATYVNETTQLAWKLWCAASEQITELRSQLNKTLDNSTNLC